ncbi:3-dehydroquinate synthase [Clostridium sp. C8]|jgi:3-dehydroquinate synthase|uniref:3-dehydroquinate synthase n=1 Tax=bioreactor metagenome TaxID=1076179 RepID=A0A644WMM2_9ZZZZ|nr:3-dehydroquinate synthase [Clostridium sp. C8]KLE14909.1 3-dehydroquinate synthase [Clostridium sp. C8]
MNLSIDLIHSSYDIVIQKGIINTLVHEIKNLFKGKKIFIITDKNVDKFYGNLVLNNLINSGYDVKKLVLKPGEETKNFSTLPLVYDELLNFKFTRSDLIITLGGGVIGDLGGFVASTYLRGVAFVQCPTTLLAQVDSSVGGKVGVDLDKGKNLVGSFYHPKKVVIDPEVLNTLSDRVFNDGMAEVIKYGCIRDKEFFGNLINYSNKKEVMHNIEYIIHNCCKIKKEIVEKDEKDMGQRMLLNFGHTIGHAIEQYFNYTKYTHGEAVAIGMYEITKLSEELGITKIGTKEVIKDILIKYQLPYELTIDINELTETMKLDKKNLENNINLIFLKEIGESFIYKTTSKIFCS